ncbi:MAG: NAD(P)H-quinone oxidoreductase [Sandaracinaceae bacterium]
MPTARAVILIGSGGPEALALGDIDVRDPGHGELLVDVVAAGLNRADLLQRRGLYPAPPGVIADVPGLEYAGRVAAVGPGVRAFAVGDRVMGIVAGGAMATHLVVHEREALPVPATLSMAEAAAVPEAFLTSYDALFLQAGLRAGERVLIHAVASGVGTAALMLAKRAGARTLGTSRTKDKLTRCSGLGLDEGILVGKDRAFAKEVKARTKWRGADVALDLVGGAYLSENLASMAPLGRVVVVGLMGGASGELPLGLLLAQRLSVRGTVLRSRPLEEKAALAQRFHAEVLGGFEDGSLRPIVDEVFPMDQVAEAHRRLESNDTFGKLVLTWD